MDLLSKWVLACAVAVAVAFIGMVVVGNMSHNRSGTSANGDWQVRMSQALKRLSSAYDEIDRAGPAAMRGNLAPLREGCRDLDGAQEGVRATLPAPDSGLDATLREAVDNIHEAASRCAEFDSSTSETEIADVTSLLTKANGQIETATRIVKGMS